MGVFPFVVFKIASPCFTLIVGVFLNLINYWLSQFLLLLMMSFVLFPLFLMGELVAQNDNDDYGLKNISPKLLMRLTEI